VEEILKATIEATTHGVRTSKTLIHQMRHLHSPIDQCQWIWTSPGSQTEEEVDIKETPRKDQLDRLPNLCVSNATNWDTL